MPKDSKDFFYYEWAALAYRVCTELDENQMDLVKGQTLALFEHLLQLRKTKVFRVR